MGGSSSSEASPSDTDAKFQERVAQIIAEESRKQDESRAVQAARDARIKDLMRDVLKEAEAKNKSSSHDDASATRNTMIMSILTQLLASRGTDPDKSKMINYLLDMQQQIGGSGSKSATENAYLTKFIETQLESLQSMQDVKITVEKKSSSASSQHHNVGQQAAGPSWVGAESSTGTSRAVSQPHGSGAVSPQTPTPPPAYSEVPPPSQNVLYKQTLFQTCPAPARPTPPPQSNVRPTLSYTANNAPLANSFQKNIANPPSTCKDNQQFQNSFTVGSKPVQQNFPNQPPPYNQGNKPFQQNFPNQPPTYNQGNKPSQQNFPNQPAFKNNRPFQDAKENCKPFQQNFLNPPSTLKEKQPCNDTQQKCEKVSPFQNTPFTDPLNVYKQFPDYGQFPNKHPPSSNKNNQFQEKPFQDKMPFKDGAQPQGQQNFVKKNRETRNNAPFKNNNPGNENSPFLDKGPLLHDKGGSVLKVEQDSNGNFYVKVPPPLLDSLPNRGRFNRGRGGGPNQRDGPNQHHGPDTRRSESPHHTHNRYQNRNEGRAYDETFQGPNHDNALNYPRHPENQRGGGGGFQYRGRGGPRRPFWGEQHPQHFQELRPDLYGPPEGPEQRPPYGYYGQHCDERFNKQNEPGYHQPRMTRPGWGRWNNSNRRSHSQPRTRKAHHSKESSNNLGVKDQEKPDDQATESKQGDEVPSQDKGEKACSKEKPKVRKLPPKPKNPEKWPAWYAKFGNNADDSDRESVKSESSLKSNTKIECKEDVYIAREDGIIFTAIYNFKEGVYIACEDGTIFTKIEAMGDLCAATANKEMKKKKKKKKCNKFNDKVKKASSANNVSVPQNDNTEDSESDDEEVPVPLTGGEADEKKEEVLSPLKLFLGGLDDRALENFRPDEILAHSIVLIAKVDDAVKSYHPTTVGELIALKKRYPNAEVIVVN